MPSPTAAPRNLSAADKALHLRNLPGGATRVQVRDAAGKTRYLKPEDVGPNDHLMFGPDGSPVVMRGEPGRKPKTHLAPVDAQTADVMAAKAEHLKDDQLLSAVASDPAADRVLDLVVREMAREAASLAFDESEVERHGGDTSGLSVKRARILASVGEMVIKRRDKLAEAAFDLDTPYAQAFIVFLLQTIRGQMLASGVRPEQTEAIFATLGKTLDESWKAEAKSKMREAAKTQGTTK